MKTATCFCEFCRGAARQPSPGPGLPDHYPHEVPRLYPQLRRTSTPLPRTNTSLPRTSTPLPRTVRPKKEPDTRTLEERIAAIEARTDIGAGMKAMQINNLRKKAK